MINASRFLVVLLSISFATIYAQNNSLDTQNKKEVTRVAFPSKKKKFFGALKNIMNTYVVMGMAATIFCGYLWLAHEVNSPENLIKINEQQADLQQILNQTATPRELLRRFPLALKCAQLEFFENIDLATLASAAMAGVASLGCLIFSGAEALS